MAIKYLGETLDIHAGGIDLVFPHHENEIAQSESLTGKPFSRFWLHAEFLMVEGQKMSKSLGNYYTLRDLLGKGYEPEAIRYLLASVPYRKQLNFTMDGLRSARTAIERLRNFKLRLETDKFPDGSNDHVAARTQQAAAAFVEAMDHDLNTAEALAAAFEYIRDANSAMDAGEFRAADGRCARFPETGKSTAVFERHRTHHCNQRHRRFRNRIAGGGTQRRQEGQRLRARRPDSPAASRSRRAVLRKDTKSGVRWKRK